MDQLERTIREFAADLYGEAVGLVELRIHRPDGELLEVIDLRANGSPSSTPSAAAPSPR